MKRGHISRKFLCFVLSLCTILQLFVFPTPAQAITASVDYAVDSFSADYYVSKDENGISTAHVKETIKITFPNYNRNHGFDRELPFFDSTKDNQIMGTTPASFSVKRNGESEPFKAQLYNGNLLLEIGSRDVYLHGQQTYTIEYDLRNLALDFTSGEYLDTDYLQIARNITGSKWSTGISNISVNFHFDKNIYSKIIRASSTSKDTTFQTKTLIHPKNTTKNRLSTQCIIRRAGKKGDQSACDITDISDGFNVKVKHLTEIESVSVYTNFQPDTFKLQESTYNKGVLIKDLNSVYTIRRNAAGESVMHIFQKIFTIPPSSTVRKSGFTWGIPITGQGNTRTTISDINSIKITMDGEEFTPEIKEYDEGYLSIHFENPTETAADPHTYTVEYELSNVTNSIRDFRPKLDLFNTNIDDKTKPGSYISKTSDADELILPFTGHVWGYNINHFTTTINLEDGLMDKLASSIPANVKIDKPIACVDPKGNPIDLCEITATGNSFQIVSKTNFTGSKRPSIIINFTAGTFTKAPKNRSYLIAYLAIVEIIFLAVVILLHRRINQLAISGKTDKRHLATYRFILYTSMTIFACVLIFLIFNPPSVVYTAIGESIHSEKPLTFLQCPLSILLIVVCGILPFRRTQFQKPNSTKKGNSATIIIATHKQYRMPSDKIYLPLRVGAKGNPSFGYKTDSTGDNISDKNPAFCELTGLYWAWKNIDSDYIGLVHYRRYLSLHRPHSADPEKRLRAVLSSTELDNLINPADQSDAYDLILPRPRQYFIENLYSHYKHTCYPEPLDQTREIISEKCPEYLPEFDRLKVRTSAHMFNMFIMRKDILDDYCDWLFDILFTLEKESGGISKNQAKYSAFHARYYGRISELLLDVYLYTKYPNLKEDLHVKELPVVDIEKVNWLKKGRSFLLAKFKGKKYEKSF